MTSTSPNCPCCDPTSSIEQYQPFISPHQLSRICVLDDKTAIRKSFKCPMIQAESANNISRLINLPMEVFQRTLIYLDIQSLVNLRRSSQYCRLAVSSLLEWQEVSDNAPEALRAILVTGMGSHILLLQLHYALTNPECEFCPENSDHPAYLDDEKVMGAFLSLFEGKRACAYCLRNNASLRTIKFFELIRLRTHPNTAVKFPLGLQFPQLRTIPGTYGYHKWDFTERLTLVSAGSIETYPEVPLSEHDMNVLRCSPHDVFIPKHPFDKRHKMDSQLAPHRTYVGFERDDDIVRRYMTAIPFPFFGKTETHPTTKKRAAFHGCAECILQEQYHEVQFLDSFNPGDADELIISCGANIYKRETRQWLDDMVAEKRHAKNFHEPIDAEEQEWRRYMRLPIFDFSNSNIWKTFRTKDYKLWGLYEGYQPRRPGV